MNLSPFVVLNLIACAVLFWTCATFLLVRGPAACLRSFGTQIGLLVCMVGAMVSGLAPLRYGWGPDWWSLTLRVGVAIVSLAQYDKAFGIRAQLEHARTAVTSAPDRLKAWWRNAWATAQAHQRTKDGPR